jgi:N-acetylmuramoyl-L-alanine amidase
MATKPATFLELGNMRNAGDAARLSSASGRQRIAGAIAAGILAFLGH